MASLRAQSVLSLQILVLFVASVCVHDCIGGVIESRKQREFDYFALALQWPGTYCQRTRHCCTSNACCRGSNAPTEFTIHGLWPDYNDGSWPSCCTRSNFDIEKISTLLDDIQKYWPSLSCGSPSTCHGGKGLFWAHEPRDCLIGFTTRTDVLSSSSCPKYVSLPEYVSPGLKNGDAAFPWLPQHEALGDSG